MKPARGFATSFKLPLGCAFYACQEPKVPGTAFCVEHGKIKVRGTVVDSLPPKPTSNIGYKKTYR